MPGKRSFSGAPAAVEHRRADHIEAARYLATVARRYSQDRANVREVEDAIEEWRLAVESDKPFPAPTEPRS